MKFHYHFKMEIIKWNQSVVKKRERWKRNFDKSLPSVSARPEPLRLANWIKIKEKKKKKKRWKNDCKHIIIISKRKAIILLLMLCMMMVDDDGGWWCKILQCIVTNCKKSNQKEKKIKKNEKIIKKEKKMKSIKKLMNEWMNGW